MSNYPGLNIRDPSLLVRFLDNRVTNAFKDHFEQNPLFLNQSLPLFLFLREEIEAHLVSYNEMSSKPVDLVCFLYMPLGSDSWDGWYSWDDTGQLPTRILGVSLVSHRKAKKWLEH